MSKELIEFAIPKHTVLTEGEFATADAMANITQMLSEQGLVYEKDWCINSCYFEPSGEKIFLIEFINASDAMIARLRGLA